MRGIMAVVLSAVLVVTSVSAVPALSLIHI